MNSDARETFSLQEHASRQYSDWSPDTTKVAQGWSLKTIYANLPFTLASGIGETSSLGHHHHYVQTI